MEMTDAQREIVQPILEARSPGEDPRGRKPSEPRPILEGILCCGSSAPETCGRHARFAAGSAHFLCPLNCCAT